MNPKPKLRANSHKGLVLVLFFCVGSLSLVSAQKDFNIWHFGTHKGISLDFNVDPPQAKTSVIKKMAESGASICDPKTGAIRFYCNDNTIWNAQNLIMAGGTDLEGSNSTTQGSLILPHPCGCDQYLVFQNDIGQHPFTIEDYGLSYSTVDMTLENGLGKVTAKNIPISNRIAEPMIAVKDTANGYWLICHEIESYDYRVYHIGNNGIDLDFQKFTTANFVLNPGQGHLCATFDGRKIAMGQKETAYIEMLDFDIASGKLQSDTTILFDSSDPDFQYAYSVAFSPDGKMLYSADYGHLYQFDITDKNDFKRNIIYSRDTSVFINAFFTLQLAPNGKIYASMSDLLSDTDFLGVIESPNKAFPACNFNPFGIKIPQGSFAFGFPAILKNVYAPGYQTFEYGVDFDFEFLDSNKARFVNLSHNIQSYEWALGDDSVSSEESLSHVYSDTGAYLIRLTGTNKYGCKKTVEKTLRIHSLTDDPTIMLYPNPTSDVVYIKSSRAITNIKLHAISGQFLLEKKGLSTEFVTLDLNRFACQAFILTIESEGKIIRRKITKID